jgi:Zn-dependent M28 family amino/carboxypeptidase
MDTSITADAKERLYNDVLFLTSVTPARNYKNLDALNKSADYILSAFAKLNCKTEIQKFVVDGKEYKNVIASFGNPDAERIIIGAHYDVAGNQPGADDNASGVAGLLELARMLNAHQEQLSFRFDFVAYALEEPPYFATDNMGSAVHARLLKAKNIKVKAMICLEMIGYFSDKPGSQNFPNEELKKIYPSAGNFIIVVGRTGQEDFTEEIRQLMKKHSTIDVQSICLPASNQLAGLSDHRNYWSNGYGAVMIDDTSFLRNPNYHNDTDTIDTLDFAKMVEVVKGVFGVMVNYK